MAPSARAPEPTKIAAFLSARVFGQDQAVREMAIALAKKLAGLKASNILLIGPSGSGKTTLMRAVEEYLGSGEPGTGPATVLRLHANVLGQEAEQGRPGELILTGLLDKNRARLGRNAELADVVAGARHGIVFIDEVDKIRSRVGGEAHVRGVRAQEALLTLMENESVPIELPDWAGGELYRIDSRDLLIVAGGAFEGLYDAVFDRVTVGEDRGALQPVTVVDQGSLREELPFQLRDWLRAEDLFEYGMSPQFLSRFESQVLLDELGVDDLVRVLLEAPDSSYRAARSYFEAYGVDLALSPAAVRKIATAAAARKRIGARALREIFGRIVRPFEYQPRRYVNEAAALLIDEAEVDAALAR